MNSASEARQISDRTSNRMAKLSQDTFNQQNTVSQLREAASTGENLAFQVQERTDTINQRAGTILEVVEIIKDIAQLTDRLSMNALIQAAHAGEQGCGFSVVAGEIKKTLGHADEKYGSNRK
ncbi:MAG: methyl-accepting chemotaxis protein [Spirochaetia bacterium]|nr:methyl-accepting chemotaxis protein [Spirochaetia bacterium]